MPGELCFLREKMRHGRMCGTHLEAKTSFCDLPNISSFLGAISWHVEGKYCLHTFLNVYHSTGCFYYCYLLKLFLMVLSTETIHLPCGYLACSLLELDTQWILFFLLLGTWEINSRFPVQVISTDTLDSLSQEDRSHTPATDETWCSHTTAETPVPVLCPVAAGCCSWAAKRTCHGMRFRKCLVTGRVEREHHSCPGFRRTCWQSERPINSVNLGETT